MGGKGAILRNIARPQLRAEDAARLSNSRFVHLSQAKKALGRISDRFLSEDELVLLDLITLGKTDRQVAEILGISVKGAYKRRLHLYEIIAAYGWWLQHHGQVRSTINEQLGTFHMNVLVPVVHRRRQAQVASDLGVSKWRVYRTMNDCVELMSPSPDFLGFLRSLRLQYAL